MSKPDLSSPVPVIGIAAPMLTRAKSRALAAKGAKLPSQLQKIEKTADMAYQVFSGVDTAAQYGQKAIRLPVLATKITGGAKIIGVIPGLFAVVSFFQSLYKIFKKQPPLAKARAYFPPLRHANTTATAACDAAQFLFIAGAVPQKSISWIPAVSAYVLPIGGIAAGLAIWDAWKTKKFAQKVEAQIKPLRGAKGIAKASRVLSALDFVKKIGKKNLQGHCAIAEQKPLQRACTSLMNKIKYQNRTERHKAVEKGEKLLLDLKDRVREKLHLRIFAAVMAVVGVALGILFLTTPVGAALLGLSAIAGMAGLLYMWYSSRLKKKPMPSLAPALV